MVLAGVPVPVAVLVYIAREPVHAGGVSPKAQLESHGI